MHESRNTDELTIEIIEDKLFLGFEFIDCIA